MPVVVGGKIETICLSYEELLIFLSDEFNDIQKNVFYYILVNLLNEIFHFTCTANVSCYWNI